MAPNQVVDDVHAAVLQWLSNTSIADWCVVEWYGAFGCYPVVHGIAVARNRKRLTLTQTLADTLPPSSPWIPHLIATAVH